MKGDPYTLLKVSKLPAHAPHEWAEKVVLVVKNQRNGMTCILPFDLDGSSYAVPRGMEDEIDDIAAQFASEILQFR